MERVIRMIKMPIEKLITVVVYLVTMTTYSLDHLTFGFTKINKSKISTQNNFHDITGQTGHVNVTMTASLMYETYIAAHPV